VRYAVAGMGWIAQKAVLPAFAHASNSELVALITSDAKKAEVVGTKGDLRLEPAYDYHEELHSYVTVDGKIEEKSFPQRDQFGAELIYFSRCVLEGRDPQPCGREGLADVRIIRAILSSLESGRVVEMQTVAPPARPNVKQEIQLPPVKPAEAVEASSPSGGR